MKLLLLSIFAALTSLTANAAITEDMFPFYQSFEGNYVIVSAEGNNVCPEELSVKYSKAWYFDTGRPMLTVTGTTKGQTKLVREVDSINANDEADIDYIVRRVNDSDRKAIETVVTGCYSGRLCWRFFSIAQITYQNAPAFELIVNATKDSEKYNGHCIFKKK